jgi:hypothetical protein
MLDSLSSLLALAVLLLAAYGLGRPVVRRLRCEELDPLAGSVWSLALGLVLGGGVLMILGLVGWLYRPLIGVITFSAAFWALHEVRQAWLTARSTPTEFVARPPQWLARGLFALAALAAAGAFVGALAPATDGDALCYHLELPKLFLAQHAIYCPVYNDHATFPLLTEMWYLWALALDGPVAAQLVHWALGILLSLAAVLLAEVVLGRSWAWLAGAVVLLVPGITNQMTAALNDAALAAFTTLALAAWLRALTDEANRRWLLLAGLFLGAALAIKFTALLFAAAVAVAWLSLLWRAAGRRMWHLQNAASVLVLAASVAGPWYVRAAWHRGNPVYPFFSQHLGDAAPDVLPKRKTPLSWDASSLASLPWQLTMHSERFGGRGHQLGPVFLLILPGLFIARRLRGLGLLLGIAAAYTLLWYALRQNVRFLYPVASLLAAAVVWFWMELRRLPAFPRIAAACVFAAASLVGTIASLNRSWSQAAVAIGWQSRQEYLLEHEPSYAAALTSNRILSAESRILSQDYRTFYFNASVTRETVFRRATHYDQQIEHPTDLAGLLRDSGFTHLLLAEAAGPGIRYNSRLSKLVEAAREEEPWAWLDLADYEFRDTDGALRRYRLVALR